MEQMMGPAALSFRSSVGAFMHLSSVHPSTYSSIK